MSIDLIAKIAPKNAAFTGMVDAAQVLGGGAYGTLPDACVASTNVIQHLPAQSGQDGKYLKTSSSTLSWDTPGGGGFAYTTAAQTAATRNETATSGYLVILCDCTSNAITVNLPTAVGNTAMFTIKKTNASANAVTVDAYSTQTIDAGLTAVLSKRFESIDIINDNANWSIV